MRLLRNITRLGQQLLKIHRIDEAHELAGRRKCQVEQLEQRMLMTAATPQIDAPPQIIVGGTEYEQAAGNDSQPNVFVVTFEGGAAGTQLTHLEINGSKSGGPLFFNDAIFDTAAGGLGAYGYHPIQIVSHDGFQVLDSTANDGSTLLTMDFSGFTAGMKLVFTVDVDQVIYIDPTTNAVDVDAVDEGAEFQRSQLSTTFTAPHYESTTVSTLYWDVFDANVAAAEQQAGENIDLPNDAYTNTEATTSLDAVGGPDTDSPMITDVSDMTAGAVSVMAQTPLPADLAGKVYEDHNLNNQIDAGDQGVAGVSLELWQWNGTSYVDTGKSTITDAQGNYKFANLLPGSYQVVKTNPAGYFSVGATAGNVNGTIDAQVQSPDVVTQISLQGGDDSEGNNFALALPATLSGFVYEDKNDDGQRESGEPGIGGVTISLVPVNVVGTAPAPIQVVTKADGSYSVGGLNPGVWKVVEVTQPAGYLDGKATAGTLGGTAINPGDEIDNIPLGDGQSGQEYDFGKLLPNSIAGRVLISDTADCPADPNPTPLPGVTVELLNSSNQIIATTTSDSQGNYSFTGLPPGTYSVADVQPAGYIPGCSVPGSLGGTSVDHNLISTITVVSDLHGTDYDFYVHPYSTLAGSVHIDMTGAGQDDTSQPPLAGATLELLDATGNVLQTTTTDANGNYSFGTLTPGTYSVRELQPNGYYFEVAFAGSVGGTVPDNHDVDQISLPLATNAQNYNFFVIPPGSISGRVHNDVDGQCETNPNEPGLAGVTVQLLNASGNILQTTVTDASGDYSFNQLGPGTYTVHEVQPAGYIAEDSDPGSAGGVSVDDNTIGSIQLGAGVNGVNYNFCEVQPASLTGKVMVSNTPDCAGQFTLPGVAGVTVNLINSTGTLVATTTTDANGNYAFNNLLPGAYTVQDVQPGGYFATAAAAGDAGGTVADLHDIVGLTLAHDQAAMCYDFYVSPPASISGTVFQDGAPIPVIGNQTVDVPAVRDGILRPGDPRIAGVTLELRDGITGAPILGSQALPGYYDANSPITVKTDANGDYTFAGLPAGNYAVFEIRPGGYLDGITRQGSTGGVVIGPYTQTDASVLAGLTVAAPADAILEITITGGGSSVSNNFSVVATTPFIYIPNSGPPTPPSAVADMYPLAMNPLINNPQPLTLAMPSYYTGSSAVLGFTWHLSVIDAGAPRGPGAEEPLVKLTAAEADELAWQTGMEDSEWTLGPNFKKANGEQARKLVFGMRGAKPVAGDFNGDGVTDLGVFKNGQWFIDLNGNSVWDEGDLWAKMGHDGDKPVVGDWDGDGKDDIGIFGKAWAGDPRAIAEEPGLPDSNNRRTHTPKNVPPQPENAALGVRSLKRTAQGETRADLIDHVFHYGTPRDVPVVGDFNGDGTDTIAVFNDGTWYEDVDGDGKWTSADTTVQFGQAGDVPVVGDFNGDGIDEIGVYRNGVFYLDTNGNGKLDAQDEVIEMGQPGDVPVVGDWDGDGREEVGVYRDGDIARHTARKAG